MSRLVYPKLILNIISANIYILSIWQDGWNDVAANKLHSIKLVLGNWQSSHRQCKKDETVL